MPDPVFVDDVTPLNAVNMNKLQTRDEKAAANGYPSLDGSGKVPLAQLPAIGGGADLSYDGDWVAGTYQDGDVVVKDGVAFICVGGPTTVASGPGAVGVRLPDRGLRDDASRLSRGWAGVRLGGLGHEPELPVALPLQRWLVERLQVGVRRGCAHSRGGGGGFNRIFVVGHAVDPSRPSSFLGRATTGNAYAAVGPTATGYLYMGVHNASLGGRCSGACGRTPMRATGCRQRCKRLTIPAASQTSGLRFQGASGGQVSDRSMSLIPKRVA